jgi:hypothetical protein
MNWAWNKFRPGVLPVVQEAGGVRWAATGGAMTKGDEYRRYAAECLVLGQRRENAHDKARLIEMAAIWLRLAEFVEKHQDADDSPKD